MLRRLLFAGFAAIFLLLLLPTTCKAKLNHHRCHSSCGNIPDISYPFRLKMTYAGNNRTILHLYSGRYYVEEINYNRETIRVVDTGLKKDDCSSLPLHSLTDANFSYGDPYRLSYETSDVNFVDCEAPINSSLYIDMAPCSLVVGFSTTGQKIDNSLPDIHNRLLYGTDLRWCNCVHLFCTPCVLAVAAKIFFGVPCVLIFLIYKWKRRSLSMYCAIEEFIQTHNNLKPIRYSYSNIKKMTKGFAEKSGEGGYGSVYKGKLKSGHLVAVKMLANSKANGQDFINEVATIGRIHHFNVVQLIGFCVEGSKQALVYDFMPNGSLDKYIFPEKEEYISLSFEKMYQISLGVAHGIEYLHRGCDMQILHFDIKPHNILLDKNFTPKVSDFGLAKSYPADHSIASLTGARGTRGYMAPELFYKNIGGVSYKADVYSFGMLLMEMAVRRRNLNVFAEHSSQIYFPFWAYDQFNEGKDIEIGDATEEEQKLAKKMVLVALWCIQFKPSERPSMHKVIEMLEGKVDQLQMPPKPSLTPQEV
ncbi:hypothetical protein PVL29_021624 [Vitis rotundifolia]|uniref:Protein kinase domain-containing protein n=1 Tax=Vitis rotundifolia TaxID=103349 RepID=A0AA38Z0A0_VITRO|nr:hypothetical protein PVL29_021624 [Vitis rotundifolia]